MGGTPTRGLDPASPASSRRRFGQIVGAFLALVFAVQPLVVFVSAYHSRDCDDKAVHFFSAMYWHASGERRAQFHAEVEPLLRAHASEPTWWRTEFRLRQTGTYPLASLAIGLLHRPGRHFTVSVKYGLLTVTILAELAVLVLASRTPFGLWPTLLVLEAIAFHAVGTGFLIADFPRNMHPFVWHAPRAPAALLVLPAVLTAAAHQRAACVASLAILGLLHAWLGLVCAVFTVVALGVSALFAREGSSFERRALVLSVVFFCLLAAASGLLGSERVVQPLERATGVVVLHELPVRMSGVQYSLLVLGVVLAGRLALRAFAERLALPATLALLVAVPLVTPEHYQRVLTGRSGFFVPNCPGARAIPLPAGAAELSLDDEATLFRSLGEYLAEGPDRLRGR